MPHRSLFGVAATYHGAAVGAAVPPPLAFTARTLKRYSVPLVRLETTYDVVDALLPGMGAHLLHPTPADRT